MSVQLWRNPVPEPPRNRPEPPRNSLYNYLFLTFWEVKADNVGMAFGEHLKLNNKLFLTFWEVKAENVGMAFGEHRGGFVAVRGRGSSKSESTLSDIDRPKCQQQFIVKFPVFPKSHTHIVRFDLPKCQQQIII